MTSEIEDSEGLLVDCSREQDMIIERSRPIGYFETRVDWRTVKSDNSR